MLDRSCVTGHRNQPWHATTRHACLLVSESQNLWKKPTFSLSPMSATCGSSVGVLTEFCNNNAIMLKAIGFIKDDEAKHMPFPQKKICKCLQPLSPPSPYLHKSTSTSELMSYLFSKAPSSIHTLFTFRNLFSFHFFKPRFLF